MSDYNWRTPRGIAEWITDNPVVSMELINLNQSDTSERAYIELYCEDTDRTLTIPTYFLSIWPELSVGGNSDSLVYVSDPDLLKYLVQHK